MTISEFQRAMLAEFALREAGPGASLEEVRAIAICLRNRVKLGMNTNIVQAIEQHENYRANLPTVRTPLDVESRNLQRFVREVDEIYFDNRDPSSKPQDMPSDFQEMLGRCCFWARMNEPFTPWFKTNILHDPDNHAQHPNMGLMMFFE